MEQKIIDKTHLLQFSNFELLTTGLRRIFNLSRRRSKRYNRDNAANEINLWWSASELSYLIMAFRSSKRCVRYLNFSLFTEGMKNRTEKEVCVQWEWLAAIIWVKKKRKGKSKLTLPFPPAFLSLYLLLLNPSLLETPRVSARYGHHKARCFPTVRKWL